MNKIYQCQDSIEQGKFLLAALKIQTAFQNLHHISSQKTRLYYQTFFFLLSLNSNRVVLQRCEKGFDNFAQCVQNIKQKRKRSAFHLILIGSEKWQRKSSTKYSRERSQLKRSRTNSEIGQERVVKSVSVIEEQNWKDKMTMQELQASCDFYTSKIKEVEKSFSQFFHIIKRQ